MGLYKFQVTVLTRSPYRHEDTRRLQNLLAVFQAGYVEAVEVKNFTIALRTRNGQPPKPSKEELTFRQKIAPTCTSCDRKLDNPDDRLSESLGGDCLACMAEFGDPDAVKAVIALAREQYPHSKTKE